MVKNIVRIDGMTCNICKTHVNDATRKQFPDAKRMSASHGKKEANFVIEGPADETAVKKMIDGADYHYEGLCTKPYEKKGFFGPSD